MKYRSVTMDDRVSEVLTWFDGDPSDFPDFGVLYFEEPDTTGHDVGPHGSKVSVADALLMLAIQDGRNVNTFRTTSTLQGLF